MQDHENNRGTLPGAAPLGGGAASPRLFPDNGAHAPEKIHPAQGEAPASPTAAGGRDHAEPPPEYLASLLALPGVPRQAFDGLCCETAFIELAASNGKSEALPLGHLGPVAVDVLVNEFQIWGHVRARLYARHGDRLPFANFAFRLPAPEVLPGADAGAAAPTEAELVTELRRQRDEAQAEKHKIEAELFAAQQDDGLEKFVSKLRTYREAEAAAEEVLASISPRHGRPAKVATEAVIETGPVMKALAKVADKGIDWLFKPGNFSRLAAMFRGEASVDETFADVDTDAHVA